MGIPPQNYLGGLLIAAELSQRAAVDLEPFFDHGQTPAWDHDPSIGHLSGPADGGLGAAGDPHGQPLLQGLGVHLDSVVDRVVTPLVGNVVPGH